MKIASALAAAACFQLVLLKLVAATGAGSSDEQYPPLPSGPGVSLREPQRDADLQGDLAFLEDDERSVGASGAVTA